MEKSSRREFFEKFIPRRSESADSAPAQEMNGSKTEYQILSRREFLKFISSIGAAFATGEMGAVAEAQENEEGGKKIDTKQENSYTETAIEQSLMMAARYIAETIFEKLKIEYGNKTLSGEDMIEYFRDKPIKGLLEVGILGPAIEETLFRALPSGFIDKNDKRHRWEIGIPTSFLFALIHNFKKEELGELQFVKSVPIGEFMSGLFYWYLMRVKGYSHAVMAHSMNNTIAMSIGILLFKAYPEEKAMKMAKKIFSNEKE